MDLESVTMSGTMPDSSKLKNPPVRPQPICTSSTMSTMPWRVVRSRSFRSHSGVATLMPPSPCTVSTMTPAGVSTPEPESSSSLSKYAWVSVSPPR